MSLNGNVGSFSICMKTTTAAVFNMSAIFKSSYGLEIVIYEKSTKTRNTVKQCISLCFSQSCIYLFFSPKASLVPLSVGLLIVLLNLGVQSTERDVNPTALAKIIKYFVDK